MPPGILSFQSHILGTRRALSSVPAQGRFSACSQLECTNVTCAWHFTSLTRPAELSLQPFPVQAAGSFHPVHKALRPQETSPVRVLAVPAASTSQSHTPSLPRSVSDWSYVLMASHGAIPSQTALPMRSHTCHHVLTEDC